MAGAAVLRDRRIVVALRDPGEIRFFDSTGKYLFRAGRQGHGPGEFATVQSLEHLRGDTILIVDPQLRRVSLFDPEGQLAGTLAIPLAPLPILREAVSRLSNGELLTRDRPIFYPLSAYGEVRRDSFAIVGVSANGAVDTLLVTLGNETYQTTTYEGSSGRSNRARLRFGLVTSFVTDGERIYIGANLAGGVQVHSGDGRLLMIIRTHAARERVRPEHIRRVSRENLARLESTRVPEEIKAGWRRNEASAKYSAEFGFYDRVLLGAKGTIWLERPSRFEGEAKQFVVHDSTGRAVATASCAPGFLPFEVSPDEIIGLWRDDDGRNHVMLYRLRHAP